MYEKTDDKEMFKRVKTFAVPVDGKESFGGSSAPPSRVRSITLSPSEETLVCAMENNQMYLVDLADCDILKEEEMVFELLSNPFHSKAVTGIDACVKKPLVATCSADKTVRVWNYLDMSLELEKTFVEEAFSVSFHPSGLHVLVGFADKLRLCNLLVNDVSAYKEFAVKACRECRFSNGGQLFAAVNGSVVQVYDAYTAENVGNFRGHGERVKSVFWSGDDENRLVRRRRHRVRVDAQGVPEAEGARQEGHRVRLRRRVAGRGERLRRRFGRCDQNKRAARV